MEGVGYESAFVVNVNWNPNDREWNVNTWHRDDNEWNEGNRVFSPETTFFLPPNWRKFLFVGLYASRLSDVLPGLNLRKERHTFYRRIRGPPRRCAERT